ncbi:hypothetical protein B296_00053240 [Ensete ventricosum]|uniref:Ubiquitin-like domain-containing protein n=1 Tax=Ensete ventricosum TaxID=4639 RepID=A0A426X6P7_ENSVE|nr:hypothetical protein B296_00053240 [Ensete ventricosum]
MTLADPREINYATPLRTNHASIPHATPGGPRGVVAFTDTPGERAAGRAVPSVVVAIAAAVSQEGAERSVSVCGRGWRRGTAVILWIPKIQGGKMRSKAGGRPAAFSPTKESPPPAEKAAEWEVRPCGMLVQKRGADADATATPVPTIRVKVKHGSVYHEIYVSSQATFGELKKALSAKTGLHPLDMKLLYKDKERESTAFLDTAGVKDKSKVVLEEDPTAQAKRLLEMRKTDKMEKAAKSIAAISLEVDRLASKVISHPPPLASLPFAEVCRNLGRGQDQERDAKSEGSTEQRADAAKERRAATATSNSAAEEGVSANTEAISTTEPPSAATGGGDDEMGNIRLPVHAIHLHVHRGLVRSACKVRLGAILSVRRIALRPGICVIMSSCRFQL